MESNKDEMQACLGLLLELAADMAPSGQICCHKLQCFLDSCMSDTPFQRYTNLHSLVKCLDHRDLLHFLQLHVVPCFGLVMQVVSGCCCNQPSQWCNMLPLMTAALTGVELISELALQMRREM